MKKLILIQIVLALALTSCSQSSYVMIRNVDVFDGNSIQKKVNVIFSDSLIIDITTKEKHYKHLEIIDGEGMTILPPILNAHVHVRGSENLKEALEAGVFGLLDMFSTDNRSNSLRTFRDSLAYANYYSSNVGATVPGGHGTQFGVSIPVIDSTLSGSDFVRDRIAQNADYIKITQEYSMAKLTRDQVEEITIEAGKNQKKVIGHISTLADGLMLAEAGIDGLAHIWYRQGSEADEAERSLLAAQKVFIVPTLSVIEKVIKKAEAMGLGDEYLSFEEVQREVKKAYDSGIKLLAGTDSPNYQMNYSTQLFEELVLLKKCGIPEEALLKMVTMNIYESFDLAEFGPLKKGQVASFLLVNGRPHETIEDIRKEKRVWKRGIEIVGS